MVAIKVEISSCTFKRTKLALLTSQREFFDKEIKAGQRSIQ